jgi:hypothetical protein
MLAEPVQKWMTLRIGHERRKSSERVRKGAREMRVMTFSKWRRIEGTLGCLWLRGCCAIGPMQRRHYAATGRGINSLHFIL